MIPAEECRDRSCSKCGCENSPGVNPPESAPQGWRVSAWPSTARPGNLAPVKVRETCSRGTLGEEAVIAFCAELKGLEDVDGESRPARGAPLAEICCGSPNTSTPMTHGCKGVLEGLIT
jgi:hypothetical protein